MKACIIRHENDRRAIITEPNRKKADRSKNFVRFKMPHRQVYKDLQCPLSVIG
jgi:hypothetical protein